MTRPNLRRLPILAAAASCALAAGVAPAGSGEGGAGDVVYCARDTFRIPFAASAADLASTGATEARLLVSTDGGSQWSEAGTAAPGEGGFRYAAPADGEYWFSVLTVDALGRPAPADVAITPQLHVRVDRVAPRVNLEAAPAGDGTMLVRWSTADPEADDQTLSVTFTPEGGAAQRVPVEAGRTGSFRIPLDRSAGSVTVSIADAAGNVGAATRSTTPHGAAVVSYLPPASDPRSRVPYGDSPGATYESGPVRTAALPTFAGLVGPSLPAAGPVQTAPAPLPMPREEEDAYVPVPPAATPAPMSAPMPPAAPTVARQAFAPSAEQSDSSVLKTRAFKIGYAVDTVGSSGVGKVELYITPDGGRHWYSYGEDADRRSPAEISVPGDGEYGFSVRVRSGAGLAAPPPRNGEAPEMSVTVDGTPPTVEILSVGQGRGAEANRLSLAWRIVEDRPAAASVRIELGSSAGGPWELIRDWHADAGAAFVPLESWSGAGAGRAFVRVTARDAAGNERSAVTPNGVAIDLTRPTARVLGIVR